MDWPHVLRFRVQCSTRVCVVVCASAFVGLRLGQSQKPASSFTDPIEHSEVVSIPILVLSRRPLFLPTLYTTLFAQISQYQYTELYVLLYIDLHVKHIDFEGAIILGSEIVSEIIWIV